MLLSSVLDVLIELGQRGFGFTLRRDRRAHPVVAGICAFLLGALFGAASSWLWPARLVEPVLVPGASLIVTPLLNGAFMRWYGSRRERRGHPRFFLATFWGGALFAFGLSLARFLAIGG